MTPVSGQRDCKPLRLSGEGGRQGGGADLGGFVQALLRCS